MRRVVISIAIVLVAAALIGILMIDQDKKSTDQSTKVTDSSRSTNQPNTVSMTANGFEPTALTVKKGDTVTFINNDTEEHWPASDDHPSHLIYPEFDPKLAIKPGQKWSFRFDKVGIWGMHDHLFPSFHGTITVKE